MDSFDVISLTDNKNIQKYCQKFYSMTDRTKPFIQHGFLAKIIVCYETFNNIGHVYVQCQSSSIALDYK